MNGAVPPTPRRRHGRSATAIVDLRSISRSESYPTSNVRPEQRAQPWGGELLTESPGASGSHARMTATKIMTSVRRSFSTPRKRDASPMGMYSTAVESRPPALPRYSIQDAPRPTIQQIAMGLHISRTPHLHPPHSPPPYPPRGRHPSDETFHSHGSSSPVKPLPVLAVAGERRRGSASASMLPPPPKRSSLKKPGTPTTPRSTASSAVLTPTASDLSLTGSTLTAAVPPPQARQNRSGSMTLLPARLQMSMSRLLRVQSSRKTSMANPTMSTTSTSDGDSLSAELSPRKTVRFSSSPSVDEHEAVS
ncbi:hypothetical protein POSPLADRAFT_1055112 [Postia placenta MAD-698-R-SB12]|uniref:Uncharacterized protein n=1 Tax=Postia placenta MAD-698-R-SB12 TaxID=670580 RepID=A0A1X6N794_9APHY|nr:hypothetical protein POSPLADRAFT_1055112 [Postia placenta MAD-698-R-SB12]OSX64495.1 hypothetical protein POSPLADRAFT_1055112 [Postia placenta MAD-698-R-SB12]